MKSEKRDKIVKNMKFKFQKFNALKLYKELNSYGSHQENGVSTSNSTNTTTLSTLSSTNSSNTQKLSSTLSCAELKNSTKHPANLVSNDFSPTANNNFYNKENMITKNRRLSWASFKSKSLKVAGLSNRRNRALTVTLFGVVGIFFICHFPAVITKIIYVLFPAIEFEKKSMFASIILDISNFLIMLNSSINFILYIVFGPGKFREEFSIIFFTIFSSCFKLFRFRKRAGSVPNENFYGKLGFINRRNRKNLCLNELNKTSIQDNSIASTPMLDITFETLNEIDAK